MEEVSPQQFALHGVEESWVGCHIRHISLCGEDVGTVFRTGVRGHLQGYFGSEVTGLVVFHVRM